MSYGWSPYVPVAKRHAKARKAMDKLRKKGKLIQPVEKIHGRLIARTFWGKAWCEHLEQFSDYSNRLPRGRTYVRNGSVCHLEIKPGYVKAIVSGSSLYHIEVEIKPLKKSRWQHIRQQCAGKIGTLLELLQGRLSDQVMDIVTHPTEGLFPESSEINLHCDCPDYAELCKHLAAVLYGIGARLDEQPELLFTLRQVDHQDLVSTKQAVSQATSGKGKGRRLASGDIAAMFDVEMEDTPAKSPLKKTAAKKKAVVAKTARIKKAVKPKSTKQTKAPATSRVTTKKASTKKTTRPLSPSSTSIALLRKQAGMSRSEFAKAMGVSLQTITNWENSGGKLKLQARSLQRLTQFRNQLK